MGRTVSVYLEEKLVELLRKQGKSVSGIVNDALRAYFRPGNRKKGFDLVIQSARKIGAAGGFRDAEREWLEERGKDRW